MHQAPFARRLHWGPWHLSERKAPIRAPCWLEMWPPPPTQGHTAPEPKHRTIWCESGLMKVQHGAKWVSTAAGWGANDKTAPWAHCCCWYLCQGIWQLAECLTCAISYQIYSENVLYSCFLSSSSISLWPPLFLTFLYFDGLFVWLLGHKYFFSEEIVKLLFLYFKMWMEKKKNGREWYWLLHPVGSSVSFGAL